MSLPIRKRANDATEIAGNRPTSVPMTLVRFQAQDYNPHSLRRHAWQLCP
jgi:hypothetical protein